MKIYKVVIVDEVTHRIDLQGLYFSQTVANIHAAHLSEKFKEQGLFHMIPKVQSDYIHNEPIIEDK